MESNEFLSKRFAEKLFKLIIFAHQKGIELLPFSLFRTAEEQNEKYKKKLSNIDGYNKISKHQLGRAIDIAIKKEGRVVWERNEDYEILGQYWEDLGGVWGGRFKSLNDIYHFEY